MSLSQRNQPVQTIAACRAHQRSHLELAFGARVGVGRIVTSRAATSWSNFPEGQFSSGAAYYSDYRYQRHSQENMNLGRTDEGRI
jgi:hypothetical protein